MARRKHRVTGRTLPGIGGQLERNHAACSRSWKSRSVWDFTRRFVAARRSGLDAIYPRLKRTRSVFHQCVQMGHGPQVCLYLFTLLTFHGIEQFFKFLWLDQSGHALGGVRVKVIRRGGVDIYRVKRDSQAIEATQALTKAIGIHFTWVLNGELGKLVKGDLSGKREQSVQSGSNRNGYQKRKHGHKCSRLRTVSLCLETNKHASQKCRAATTG